MVTPHVGVWIETKQEGGNRRALGVTPHVGVWIETSPEIIDRMQPGSHTSCRCVD